MLPGRRAGAGNVGCSVQAREPRLCVHNILVDSDFNTVGIVDFDAVMSLPMDAAAQYPVLSGLEPDPPSFVYDKTAALRRIKRTRPHI